MGSVAVSPSSGHPPWKGSRWPLRRHLEPTVRRRLSSGASRPCCPGLEKPMHGLPSRGQCWVPGGLQPQRMSPRARRCKEMCLPLPGWLWSWGRLLRCRQCLGLARQPLRMSHLGLYHVGWGGHVWPREKGMKEGVWVSPTEKSAVTLTDDTVLKNLPNLSQKHWSKSPINGNNWHEWFSTDRPYLTAFNHHHCPSPPPH